MNIYDESEFEGLDNARAQQLANEIQQRFNQRRAHYHNLRNSPFIKSDTWHELNKRIVEFDQNQWTPWQQKWKQVTRTQDIQQQLIHFEEGQKAFSDMDDYVDSITPLPVYEHSDSVESLKSEIIDKVDNDLNNLSTAIKAQISEGIQDLIDLKAEYKLQDTFAENIKDQKGKSNRLKNIFLGLFIVSLSLIPLFILISFSITELNELKEITQWGVRVTVSITLGFLSFFLFSQYRIYQILNLKHIHLFNFIGGGATFISELIGLEDTSKREVNRKLANLFIELDDVIATIKRVKHPTENAIELSSKTIDSISKNLVEIAKSVNKNA